MLHDSAAQTLLALELCCRSLAQRILLVRELQAYAPPLGAGPEDPAAPLWDQEIRRHLRELPDLENRFRQACAEYQTLRAAPLGQTASRVPENVRSALQDLICTGGQAGPAGT